VSACEHTKSESEVIVSKVIPTAGGAPRFEVLVRISCAVCGVPFRFGSPAHAVSEGTELHVPIEPARSAPAVFVH
jgi:hypothetical protein